MKFIGDCVVVGATATGRVERFVLGSVSAAVADQARRPVEVVRAASRRVGRA